MKTNEEKKFKPLKPFEVTVKANKKGQHNIPFMNFMRIFFFPLYWCLRPYKLYGNKKVADGAFVYVCNHYSMFDAVYPASTTWEGIHFVTKREAFDYPVAGSALRAIKALSVNRDGTDLRAMLDCFKVLRNNEKVCIFPEGTRNKTNSDDFLEFHHGAAAMAIKTKVPVIPMVLYKKPRLFRMTHVIVGEPFELSEYYDRKLSDEEAAEADEKIRQAMLKLREDHKQYLESKKAKGKKA